MATSGSVRLLILDSVTYRVHGDVDLESMIGKYENEALPTTGGNIQKKTLRVQSVTGLELSCSRSESEDVKALQERTESFPMILEYMNGDRVSANGFINFSGWTSAEQRGKVDLFPDDKWVVL